MGIELGVLTSHPEYELLFVATEEARASGFKNPANAPSAHLRIHGSGVTLMSLIPESGMRMQIVPVDNRGQASTEGPCADIQLIRRSFENAISVGFGIVAMSIREFSSSRWVLAMRFQRWCAHSHSICASTCLVC